MLVSGEKKGPDARKSTLISSSTLTEIESEGGHYH
jgi:hypothetical protein